MVDCIGRLVNDYAVDAFHLDQSAFPINDLHHDHMRGVGLLFEELQAALPGVLFTGEGTSEWGGRNVRALVRTGRNSVDRHGIGAVARLG